MDYNFTIFRGNKILFSSIIIDFFSLLWTLTMKLNYNHFCFHFTEMRISTHIKSFLRFKLKLVTLVTGCSFAFFFLPNFDIFVTFYLTRKLKWGGGGGVQVGGGIHVRGWFRWGWGVDSGGRGEAGGIGRDSVGRGGV